MKKLVCAVLALLLFAGVLGCQAITDAAKDAVILVDVKAQENEVVVEKLCVDPDSVTEDEKVEAIRTARLLPILTGELRKMLGLDEEGD